MKQQGFSLLELSIVLVIIGLIAGGIVAGSSMIRASELRSVLVQKDQFNTAVMTFRDKYLAFPGDMKNATAFWGEAHATPATCRTTVGTGTQTCDGDGNGEVSIATGSYERFRFWQHLANAELIEGAYTGAPGTGGTNHHVIGENAPAGKISNTGWNANYTGSFAGSVEAFAGNYGHRLQIGAQHATGMTKNYAFTPEEAWSMDKKIDDGKPGQGSVITNWWDDCTDATAATDTGADYLLTETTLLCSPYYLKQF